MQVVKRISERLSSFDEIKYKCTIILYKKKKKRKPSVIWLLTSNVGRKINKNSIKHEYGVWFYHKILSIIQFCLLLLFFFCVPRGNNVVGFKRH